MDDMDELHYYQQWESALEQAQLETLDLGARLEPLLSHPSYHLAKALLFEQYIQHAPAVANSKKGMYEAFGLMKFRQGLQFVFDFIESTVDAKNQLLQSDMQGPDHTSLNY